MKLYKIIFAIFSTDVQIICFSDSLMNRWTQSPENLNDLYTDSSKILGLDFILIFKITSVLHSILTNYRALPINCKI